MDWFDQTYFALFGLPERFDIDLSALQAAYLNLQSVVHPDRFAALGAAQRRLAMQAATRINEAYQTLLDPGRRAAYLCAGRGLSANDRGMESDPAFLVEQMEWRERLQVVRQDRDRAGLAELQKLVRDRRARLWDELAQAIDQRGDFPQASVVLKRWMFVDKFGADVAAVEDSMAV